MRIIISGICGKVGRILFNTLSGMNDAVTVCGIDKSVNQGEFPVPVYKSFEECNKSADVIIDFSRPEAIYSIIPYAIKNRINVVLATTGYSAEEQSYIEDASRKIAIFKTSNMSLGVNLLADVSKQAAKFLGDSFDVEIIEQHHNMKVDAPSGTAIYIADEINKVFEGGKEYIYGRHSKNDKRETRHIGIHAIRGGTIVGKHDVMFIGSDEIVTLSHEAQSRKVFALGSIRAARYIKDKKNGYYNMDNILGKDYAVTTVSSTADTTLITIYNITSEKFSKLLKVLAEDNINLDMISRMMDKTGLNSISFTLPAQFNSNAYSIMNDMKLDYVSKENSAKLLIAGAGMAHQCGVAEEVFTLLNEIGTQIYAVTTSETEISCCIGEKARASSEKMLRNHYGIRI